MNVSTSEGTEVPGAKGASLDPYRAGDEFAGEIAGRGLLEANGTESLSRAESGQILGDVAASGSGEERGEAGQPPEVSSARTSDTTSDLSLGDSANEDGLNETIDPVPPPAMVMGMVDGHTRSKRSRAASQPAQRLQQVVGYGCHEALAIHPRLLEGRLFHNPRSRDFAHPSRSNDAKTPSTMVRRTPSPCGRRESGSFPRLGGAGGNKR